MIEPEKRFVAPAPRYPSGRRERRPSGAPPPLPHTLGLSGKAWLVMLVLVSAAMGVQTLHPVLRAVDRADAAILQALTHLRTPWFSTAARAVKSAGSGWGSTAVGLGLVALTMIFRRWRHLLVFLGAAFVLRQGGAIAYEALARPRPFGARIISGWGGFAMPSPPVAIVALILTGILYTMVVPGPARNRMKWVFAGVLALFAFARVYLGVDGFFDALYGIVLGVAIPVGAFRYFTPNEVFPISYKRHGSKAHLDVTGARGEAIRNAIDQQLGMTVLEIKPFGEEGSGGSTPLRIRLQGNPDRYVFAKLYAKSHVRADRWYKMWRTILYGKLEDEAYFQTVRRFVEYEDYTLRLVSDAGLPTPEPLGIVEITPEREYMIVMGFFDGAQEIGVAEINDDLIDQGLRLIRSLWHAGVAHRDIKPANLIVREGRLILIDVAFAQVRPSPWRQAVDLANMMLVLAVRTDPERVYRQALRYFSPEEISEAFAATRGVASPTQLRAFMKRDGRDLLSEFRRLAPPRRPVALQRWSLRRIFLSLSMIGLLLIAWIGVQGFFPWQNFEVTSAPECRAGNTMILMAQAVPSATSLPCIASLPAGWTFGGAEFTSGRARFWLNSDKAGTHAVTTTLRSGCSVAGAQEVPSDEPGTRRFEAPVSIRPFLDKRSYALNGGCATLDFSFSGSAPPNAIFAVDEAIGFFPRSELVDYVQNRDGLSLCGAGVGCRG